MNQKDMIYEVDNKFFDTQEEYREYLSNSTSYSNAYEPWTDKLDEDLKELSKTKPINELAEHFKRSKGAISSRLKKLNLFYSPLKAKIDSKIFNAIIEGYNPLTGEIFTKNSIWKNENIIKDLNNWRNSIK